MHTYIWILEVCRGGGRWVDFGRWGGVRAAIPGGVVGLELSLAWQLVFEPAPLFPCASATVSVGGRRRRGVILMVHVDGGTKEEASPTSSSLLVILRNNNLADTFRQ